MIFVTAVDFPFTAVLSCLCTPFPLHLLLQNTSVLHPQNCVARALQAGARPSAISIGGRTIQGHMFCLRV